MSSPAIPHFKPKIGLALGSGSARGWSHIGVIQALEEAGIHSEIVCGCSIGAIVAAAYANCRLQHLEEGVRQLNSWNLLQFFELSINKRGFIDSERLNSFFEAYVCSADIRIQDLDMPFATVATELHSGREIWFQEGPLNTAIWASFALPGLFSPVNYGGKWLVDGGLVNPVPVSLCRALGADVVIAVNLNGDLLGIRNQSHTLHQQKDTDISRNNDLDIMEAISGLIKKTSLSLFTPDSQNINTPPTLIETMTSSINITQDFITRSRMAGDPPDIVLSPRLSCIGLLEFDRGNEAIDEGRKCVERLLPEIKYLIDIN